MTAQNPTLGQDGQVFRFDSAESAYQLAVTMVQQASRALKLVSSDLEKGFYDREEFIEAVSRLARRHRLAEVRLLIRDVKPLVGQSHALLSLMDRLPSKISLRVMHPEYPNSSHSYLLVDSTGVVHRKDPAVYQGFACFNDAGRNRQLSEEFEAMWQRATPSPELRRLSL